MAGVEAPWADFMGRSRKPTIRCFVAMALGHPDVHSLYKRLRVVLREFGHALNIEEIEPGENIDTRILGEIDRSHYLLADLTYARPSVYFEAGYAAGKQMPVIYTCRADHLKKDGPHEVHFDVNHRKIIIWSNPADPSFADRLRTHVRSRTRTLVEKLSGEQRLAEIEARFAASSVVSRLHILARATRQMLSRTGFRGSPRDPKESIQGFRKKDGIAQTVRVIVTEQWTFAQMSDYALFAPLIVREIPKNVTREATKKEYHLIVICLGRVSYSAVDRCFSSFTPRVSAYGRSWTTILNPGVDGISIELCFTLHVLANVRSEEMLRERLAFILQKTNPDSRRQGVKNPLPREAALSRAQPAHTRHQNHR